MHIHTHAHKHAHTHACTHTHTLNVLRKPGYDVKMCGCTLTFVLLHGGLRSALGSIILPLHPLRRDLTELGVHQLATLAKIKLHGLMFSTFSLC